MFGRLRPGYFAVFGVAAIMLLWAAAVGDKPLSSYMPWVGWRRMIGIWLLPPVLWCSWVGLKVVRRRIDRPAATIWRVVRKHRHWLLRGLLFCLLLRPVASAFSAIKISIPHFVPFYADPMLAYADRLLFLGIDPWRITHAMIGEWGTVALDRIYLSWFPMMMGLVAFYCFTRNQRLQVRGLLSYALTWALLGNLLALLLASAGPCFYALFYGDDPFAPLIDIMREHEEKHWIASFGTMEWLFKEGPTATLGGGISAMPSLHIAISFLMFLTVRHTWRRRWLTAIAGLYVVVMWIGSIHLAWHYAVDGLVSIFGVAAIWWATGRFVEALSKRSGEAATLVPKSDAGAALPAKA